MKRWLGIDFSGDVRRWGPRTQQSNVWIADVREAKPRPVLDRIDRVQAWIEPGDPRRPFEWLASFLRDQEYAACAIDAPFSVPREFLPAAGIGELLQLVEALDREGRPFPRAKRFVEEVRQGVDNDEIKPLRKTDRCWSNRGLNVRSTLWCGPRGGAAMTAACLSLLHAVNGAIWPFAEDRHGPRLVEAFPMAQLREWEWPHQTYWSAAEAHRRNREAIVEGLGQRLDLGGNEARLVDCADAIDAVLCAFAAMAVTENRLACPVPEDEIAHTEGWIAVHDDC